MMKWRVLTLFCINMYRITQERYSIFLSMIVKSTPVFPVFSVGRNEHKFVICLRVKVFTCNILIEYSVVHPEWTLKHDYSTKIRTLFFLDFHSVRHFRFRPTLFSCLTISWRRPLSYRNQFTDLRCKSMDWFLYDSGFRHERVKSYVIVFDSLGFFI